MKRILGLLLALFLLVPAAEAQRRYKDARSYYREFQAQTRKIGIKNMRYLEAVVKGDDARRVNKYREMVVEQMRESKRSLARVGGFNGDDVLHREYMQALDMYLEAFEKDFGAAEELTANRYNSYDDLQKYFEAANKAEIKMLDAGYKIESAEDYFGKTYNVDLRRDTILRNKQVLLDEVTVYTRELTSIYFRVDGELTALFNAISADKGDTLAIIITNLRKAIRKAQSELSEIEPFEYDDGLEDQLLSYLEEIDGAIDEDLRPMAETFQFKYQDSDDLEDAQAVLADMKEWQTISRSEYFETQSGIIADYLEEAEY